MAVFYNKTPGEPPQVREIDKVFPFLKERGHVISIVGAGGKTSLLYEMARFCAGYGLKTLVTTTTHIYRPLPQFFADSKEAATQLWAKGSYAVVGSIVFESKLSMLPYVQLREYMELADVVLIEADGAKRMPVKVPGNGEPVILPECDIVIGVAGLDAINQPLEQVCFRLEQAIEFLKIRKDAPLTIECLVKILPSPQGTRKMVKERTYLVVLNKCDNQERKRQGEEILDLLSQLGINGIMSCLEGEVK